ncbi:MAG: MarR family transcriptional regulator [Bacillaceae bacterium]|jgi:DNA-binding MarR family transcriptional regulator|uniref:MarR family transcriptional regulator n=2 Tax=Aeribacillus TaxID=1055323 RepID=A0A165YL39_9BACI|nr:MULTISPECIES: MarR family transcriptional regulator [Aeribacillus]AXI40275.1 MarR family transcriptional regulator [Bacillaceae bacterium ZC4]REJ20690.1 MAG: MarR family transcriptional regulator [Bacillaceae bacterium]ASS92092.1 MarR family transcriptional regulator [Aeribacillus pallidus]AXI40332.1 MarR family transcriptional regulator [Bacillaceae bacterium ZC4]KZM52315.1 MarR family transcriptional regulator [Aeribacillus pallidus]
MTYVFNTVEEIEKSLRCIAAILKKKGRDILSNYSITPPQFDALLLLNESGNMTIGELSNKMYLACSTITDLIDRMEKNNLVKRVKDEKDRRLVRIQLLENGQRVIEAALAKRQEYLREVLKNFSDQEIVQLEKLLAKLQQEMKE